jgi:hypothetical protein
LKGFVEGIVTMNIQELSLQVEERNMRSVRSKKENYKTTKEEKG